MLRLRCLNLLLACITCLSLCVDTARPPLVQTKNVDPVGPTGTLDPLRRLQDSVGTATQVWANGPMEEHRTIAASRTGPMSAVYRAALASNASQECNPFSGHQCEVAINGFGTVGEVQYTFNNSRENLQGNSTQVMVACRCIGQGKNSAECGVALLVRPITLTRVGADGEREETGRHVCIYEAVGEKFSDCHSELVRLSTRPAGTKPEYWRHPLNFTYEVPDPISGDYWRADGQRGWTHDCEEAEFDALPEYNISNLRREDLRFNNHTTPAGKGGYCRPPEGVQYYRDVAEGSDDECAELYDFAAPSSAHIATQQDEIAVGQDPHTYISEKTPLTSYTELALSVSAACLGVLFAWSMYRKIMKKKNAEQPVKYFLVGLLKQVMSYALEALPLHIALAHEVGCRHWWSQFAFMDATITLAHGFTGAQGSARDSMLVITAVMGEVEYLYTNESLLALITALFDLIAIAIFILTVVRKTKHLLEEKRAREQIASYEAGLLRIPEGLSNTLRRLQRRKGIRKSRHHIERSKQWRSTYSSQSVTSDTERGDLAAEASTSQSSMSSLGGAASHSQLPLFHGMEEYDADRDAAMGNMDVRDSRNTRNTSADGTANTKG
ncbi:unnamed protein product [Chondrus crispus]|uniref:TRP C-terminal domain-containing protein n=1 Tax=Chondrus crispus TaxID=2769 RepID=R7QFH7_CHOCR|nr:unnamed protein product [Chondrus crispus]CDF36175.1 unnamed protein product [Chondrus crispus]|eukprot:XP_005715994.1 unnamed protein product [Chondrus crispus]